MVASVAPGVAATVDARARTIVPAAGSAASIAPPAMASVVGDVHTTTLVPLVAFMVVGAASSTAAAMAALAGQLH